MENCVYCSPINDCRTIYNLWELLTGWTLCKFFNKQKGTTRFCWSWFDLSQETLAWVDGGKSGQNDCLTSSAYNRLIAQRATEESHRVQVLTESTSSSSASIQVHREAWIGRLKYSSAHRHDNYRDVSLGGKVLNKCSFSEGLSVPEWTSTGWTESDTKVCQTS